MRSYSRFCQLWFLTVASSQAISTLDSSDRENILFW